MKRFILLLALALPAPSQVTLVPVQKIGGDLSQLCNVTYSPACATSYGVPTNNLAQTNYGVWGFDEGASVALADNRILFLGGDTVGTFWNGTKWVDFQTQATCQTSGGLTGGSSNCLSIKAIGLVPASSGKLVDPYLCNALPALDASLTAGQTPATATYSGCPIIPFIVNTSHTASQPAFAVPTMSGLGTDAAGLTETIVAGREPSGVFVNGTTLYALWDVTKQNRSGGGLTYQNEAILGKGGTATNLIAQSGTTELAFSKSHVWSSAPAILNGNVTVSGGTNVAWNSGSVFSSYMCTGGSGCTGAKNLIIEINGVEAFVSTFTDSHHITVDRALTNATTNYTLMQDQATNTGKFLEHAPIVINPIAYGWQSLLPSALQSASSVVCDFGSSWAYRQSNLYLLCIDMQFIETAVWSGGFGVNGASGGMDKAWYLTGLTGGVPAWTQGHEEQAIPLLSGTTTLNTILTGAGIGEHSCRYSTVLGQFVCLYGSAETLGIRMIKSTTPWGPWSAETSVLPNVANAGWAQKLVHGPSAPNPDFNATLPGNAPVACASCSGSVATNAAWDSTNTALQMGVGTIVSPFGLPGNWYGAYLWPVEHDTGSGTLLFSNVSAFDPYVPFLATLTIPGSITITAPTAAQTISGTAFNLTVSISALSATASVEYDVMGETACIAYSAPWTCTVNTYSLSFNTTSGSVTATARDILGNTLATSASVAFTIDNAIPEHLAAISMATSAPAVPWAGNQTVTATITGTNATNQKNWQLYVDGDPVASGNLTTATTINMVVPSAQFNNGTRNLKVILQDTNPGAPFTANNMLATAQWAGQIDFENGSTAMELRMNAYEVFLCTTAQTNCPTSFTFSGKVYATDESSSPATFPAAPTASVAGIVSIASCSSCTTNVVTQVAVGSTQLTYTEAGGKTRTVWVHVNTANVMPHFLVNGGWTISNSYVPGQSGYMHGIFQSYANISDANYPAAFKYGSDAVNSGFNVVEDGCLVGGSNTLSSTTVQVPWQTAQNNFAATHATALSPYGLYWNCTTDGLLRGTPQLFVATRTPSASWTPPAPQTVMSSLIGQRIATVQSVDEIGAIWGAYPLAGTLTWGNSLLTGNITCTAGGVCTVPIDSNTIQSGNSSFVILGATTNTCLNSSPASGSTWVATNKSTTQFKFTSSCGAITVTSASDPGLVIEQFVAWWGDANGNQCSSGCGSTSYVHHDAFSQIASQFNAATGRPMITYNVGSQWSATSVQNWFNSSLSDFGTIYYPGNSCCYIPTATNVFDNLTVVMAQWRARYQALTAAERLIPFIGESAGVPVNYGRQGYQVAITSISNGLVTFAAPHQITTILPWVSRQSISGSSNSAYNTNFYFTSCPDPTDCNVALWKTTFSDAVTCNRLCTANFSDGTTVPIFALNADSTSVFNSNFVVNNENNTCTTFHTPNHRGLTFTITGTNSAGGALNSAWTSNTFYYIPAPINGGCSGNQNDGGVIAQVPSGSSTGGTALIIANNDYLRGVTYYGPLSVERGPRIEFNYKITQMLAGMAGDRTYSTVNGYYQDNSADHLSTSFTNTSNNTALGAVQLSLHPRYQPIAQINWQAVSIGALLESRLAKFTLQQRLSAPDLGQFFETSLRTGTNGTILMALSFADGTLSRLIDLTNVVVGGQATIKYCAGWKGITVSTISAGTTSDTNSFDPDSCAFVAYVANPNTAAEYSAPIVNATLSDVPGAASIAIEYGYSPIRFNSAVLNVGTPLAFNCGTTGSCALPVDRAIGPVYYRLVYLDVANKVLVVGDVQTL